MVKRWKTLTKQQIFQIIPVIALLFAAAINYGISSFLSESLPSQKAAERWAAEEEPFAQISVFFGEEEAYGKGSINGLRSKVAKELEEASITLSLENSDARLWIDGYSRESQTEASRGKTTQTVGVVGVGGDFFYFHPLTFLDGYYFQPSEVMKDRVLIDEELAWKLYGSSDAEGMDIYVAGKRCVVAGVFQREKGKTARAAYGEASKIFVPLELLDELEGEKGITAYEIILPNPVSGFGSKVITEAVTGVDSSVETTEKEETGNVEILENSSRFDKIKLLGLIKQFGKRSMKKTTIEYPYWENQARAIEEYGAAFLYLALACMIFPTVKAVIFLRRKWREGREKIPAIKEKAVVWCEHKRIELSKKKGRERNEERDKN